MSTRSLEWVHSPLINASPDAKRHWKNQERLFEEYFESGGWNARNPKPAQPSSEVVIDSFGTMLNLAALAS